MIKVLRYIFLILAIFLLMYVFYRAEIYSSGTKNDVYLRYYLVASIFIFMTVLNIFIDKKISLLFFIVFFSVIVSAYLFEYYLLVNTIKSKKEIFKTKKDNIEFVVNSAKKNQNYVPALMSRQIKSKNGDLLSLSGISKKKTIHCNENGYFSMYDSDRYGFNNPDEEWNKDSIDYFLIGDSFVHGSCVNPQDTIGGNIRTINKNDVVLNLGQAGNGPLLEYATLREYLPIINAKKVLWFYYEGNDLLELSRELKNDILLNYLNDESFTQNLKKKQDIIDAQHLSNMSNLENFDISKDKFSIKLEIINFLKLFNFRKLTIERFFFKQPTTELEKILTASKSFVETNNSKLYFIYLPEYFRYTTKININYNYKKYNDVVKIVNKLNIPLLDMHKEIFEFHDDPLSFFPSKAGGHFTELGYKIIAEKLIEKIKEFE